MLAENNIITKLFECFPMFKEEAQYADDDLLPYNVLGDFALAFQENFHANNLSSSQINNFFTFVNEMARCGDEEVQNILVVEIFAIFSDEQKLINLLKEKLCWEGKLLFNKYIGNIGFF